MPQGFAPGADAGADGDVGGIGREISDGGGLKFWSYHSAATLINHPGRAEFRAIAAKVARLFD